MYIQLTRLKTVKYSSDSVSTALLDMRSRSSCRDKDEHSYQLLMARHNAWRQRIWSPARCANSPRPCRGRRGAWPPSSCHRHRPGSLSRHGGSEGQVKKGNRSDRSFQTHGELCSTVYVGAYLEGDATSVVGHDGNTLADCLRHLDQRHLHLEMKETYGSKVLQAYRP